MPNRLQELLQQRALLKEHLAWLDEEIAAAGHQLTESQPPHDRVTPAATPAAVTIPGQIFTSPPQAGHPPDETDLLLAKLAAEEPKNPPPSKRGCWLVFCSLLIVGAVGAWLLLRQLYR